MYIKKGCVSLQGSNQYLKVLCIFCKYLKVLCSFCKYSDASP